MSDAWLEIPAADYEGHMEAVQQREPLRAIFAEVYAAVAPRRLLVLGCGPGGGLEVVDPARTERIVAVDVNPEYLAIARGRHPALPAEWRCESVERCELELENDGFDLCHAALLFEHVDPAPVLQRIARWLAPGAILSVVLQLPGGDGAVSATPFTSLGRLAGRMRLVPPERLCALAEGLTLLSSSTIPLARGKAFWAGRLAR